jgi:hypothetical protein
MRISRTLIPAVLLLAFTLAGTTTAVAQDATAVATPGGPSEGYPVAIHEGTCDNPSAEPAYQLDDAISMGADQEEPKVLGSEVERTILDTSGDLDISLDDLGGSDYVVAAHASPDQFGTLAACGQIAGIVEDGKLVVALTAVGESGLSGVAILEENGDKTTATVYLIPPSNDEQATPAA